MANRRSTYKIVTILPEIHPPHKRRRNYPKKVSPAISFRSFWQSREISCLQEHIFCRSSRGQRLQACSVKALALSSLRAFLTSLLFVAFSRPVCKQERTHMLIRPAPPSVLCKALPLSSWEPSYPLCSSSDCPDQSANKREHKCPLVMQLTCMFLVWTTISIQGKVSHKIINFMQSSCWRG